MATIITSRKAAKHLEKIKGEHSEILKTLQAHQERIRQYHAQKDAEKQEALKQAQEFHMKQRELSIKQHASLIN